MMKYDPRYARHYPLIGFEGQMLLEKARCLIVGAGGIGSVVAPYLVGAGVGHIGIVDDDHVSLSNLHRQILYTEDDVGELKTDVAAKRLTKQNNAVELKTYPYRLLPDNAVATLKPYTLVIDGSDNYATRYLVNDSCCQLRIPLISASVLDRQWQAAFFDSQTHCYRCLYPEPPPTLISPSCTEAGVMGPTVGMVASFSASLALQFLLEPTALRQGYLYRFDGVSMALDRFHFTANTDCKACVYQQLTPLQCEQCPVEQYSVEARENLSSYQIVDIREPWETVLITLPGAMTIPLKELIKAHERLNTITQPILLVCKTGQRSARLLAQLRKAGRNVYQLKGGIKAWATFHGQDTAVLTGLRERCQHQTLRILDQHRKRAGITRLAQLTHLDALQLPVYTAIRPLSKSLSTSQGKGMTDEEAQCSALMESLETFYAENIQPDRLLQPITAFATDEYHIPTGHDLIYPDTYLHNWVLGERQVGQSVYLPHQYVSIDTTLPSVILAGNSTNGLASGNTKDEAILHGVLELIERIAVKGEGIVVSDIEQHPLVQRLLVEHALTILYYPNDYALPVFKCRISNQNSLDNQAVFAGHGCHLDKTIALQRALTEAIQAKVTAIAGSRDDLGLQDYRTEQLSPFRYPSTTMPFASITDMSVSSMANIAEAKALLFDKLQQCGKELITCQVHSSDIAVIKVFIDEQSA